MPSPLPSMPALIGKLAPAELRLCTVFSSAKLVKRRKWICPDCLGKQQRRWQSTTAVAKEEQQVDDDPFLPLNGVLLPGKAGVTPGLQMSHPWRENRNSASSTYLGRPLFEFDKKSFERLEKLAEGDRELISWDVSNETAPATSSFKRLELINPSSQSTSTTASFNLPIILRPNLRAKLDEAFLRQSAGPFVKALLCSDNAVGFMLRMPDSTFTQLLLLFDPSQLLAIKDHFQADIPVSSAHAGENPRINRRVKRFLKDLNILVHYRWLAGRQLSLADFKHLLKCASTARSGRSFARTIWHKMMDPKAKIPPPDTDCFNYLLKALLWDHSYVPGVQKLYRVSKLGQQVRSGLLSRSVLSKPLAKKFANYHASNKRSIVKKMKEIVNQMLRMEVPINQETLICIITAYSREGQLRAVKELLQTYWSVDVDTLMVHRPVRGLASSQHLPSIKSCPVGSPWYPTQELLFTIAHVFGTNNDIGAALRIVHYISRRYGIPIGVETWKELFQWASYLSADPSGPEKTFDPRRTRMVEDHLIVNLMKLLTSEKHGVDPTMSMLQKYTKALLSEERFDEASQVIDFSIYLLAESIQDAEQARKDWAQIKEREEMSGLKTADYTKLQRRESALRLTAAQNRGYVLWNISEYRKAVRVVRTLPTDTEATWNEEEAERWDKGLSTRVTKRSEKHGRVFEWSLDENNASIIQKWHQQLGGLPSLQDNVISDAGVETAPSKQQDGEQLNKTDKA